MVRFSTAALYLVAATLLGAVALPASMDFAATHLGGSASPSLVQLGLGTTMPLDVQ